MPPIGITEHRSDAAGLAPLPRYGERRGEHDPGCAPRDQLRIPRAHVDLGFPRGGDQVSVERLVEGGGQVRPERGDLPGDDQDFRYPAIGRGLEIPEIPLRGDGT